MNDYLKEVGENAGINNKIIIPTGKMKYLTSMI
jgi:hypothetical protein